MKGYRKGGEGGRRVFFFGSYQLLNLADKEPWFRGGALEAC